MEKIEKIIYKKECIVFFDKDAEYTLIQPVDENDLKEIDSEREYILSNTDKKFSLILFKIKEWNSELTPWEMPLVFGKGNFGDRAVETLEWIQEKLIPMFEKEFSINKKNKYILGGYSLAGLFSLWASYQKNDFIAINASSPSVWYKGWIEYITENKSISKSIYLSLGNNEEKTKNKIVSKVKENIEIQFKELKKDKNMKNIILEWNEGNHFTDTGIRVGKGFVWCLKNI